VKVKDTILPELELLEAQQHSAIPKGTTAPELADMVMRGEVKLTPQQMRAMIELLPFHAPKLSAMAVTSMSANDFAARLDRCIERSSKAKLIEARAEPTD
jgi:hypothetical protein